MKINSLLPTLIVLLVNCYSYAQQSNAVLFTENGERFTAILNGVRQNDKPETNVKITGLTAEFYKLKVIFESNVLGEKNFNLGIQPGQENTFVIKKNNKGEYVLRFMGAVAIAEAPKNLTPQTEVVYHANPVAVPANTPVTSQTTVTSTTTQGTSSTNPDAVNINVGMNVNEMGGSVNINMSGLEESNAQQGNTAVITQSQTVVTTTTTTSGGGINTSAPPAPVVYLPGYNGPVGCPVPMGNQDFEDLKESVNAKSFEETKYKIARQVLQDHCMLVSQVKQMMLIFTFEQTRLDFAKFAYEKTYDIGNFYKVNDAFTFESSIDELNEYISSKR